jgi:hypothetical protein
MKMASLTEKAQCVVWLAETKSPMSIQRLFRMKDVKLIKSWVRKFLKPEQWKREGAVADHQFPMRRWQTFKLLSHVHNRNQRDDVQANYRYRSQRFTRCYTIV